MWNTTLRVHIRDTLNLVLHSRVMTNKFLFQMGMKDSDICPRCRHFSEDIFHALFECTIVSNSWRNVESWLQTCLGVPIRIPNVDQICGQKTKYHIINKTIMATKHIIYQKRQEGKNFSSTPIKRLLYRQM